MLQNNLKYNLLKTTFVGLTTISIYSFNNNDNFLEKSNFDNYSETNFINNKNINIDESLTDYINYNSSLSTKDNNSLDLNLRINLQIIDKLSSLKENWDGYNAKSFDLIEIKRFKEIVTNLKYQPLLAPSGRKSLCLIYESNKNNDKKTLIFEINKDDINCAFVDFNNYTNNFNITFKEDEVNEINSLVKTFFI